MVKPASISWIQIKTFTLASIKSRYRNTAAGLLWVVLSPLLMFGAQSFAFKYVLKIDFANYPLFLLTGLMPWIFLMQSTNMGTGLILSQSRLLKSFPIHPLACLMAMIADNMINFLLTFFIILIPLVWLSPDVNGTNFLWMPVPLVSLFIATVGLVWLLSVSQVFFYDTRYIVEFVTSIAFFVTPIFYPRQFVGPQFQWLIDLNPLNFIFAPLQALSRQELPENFFALIWQSYAVSISIFALASFFWWRKRNMLYFRL